MTLFDALLLIALGGFTLFGLWFGFIHTLGSFVGSIAGAYIASRFYITLGEWLASIFGFPNTMKIIAFMIVFILVNRLIGLIFLLFDRIFKVVSIIPFLKTINRLLGAILGFFEGMIFIGLSLFVIVRYDLGSWFAGILGQSTLLPWFTGVANILKPLLPEALKQLKEILM